MTDATVLSSVIDAAAITRPECQQVWRRVADFLLGACRRCRAEVLSLCACLVRIRCVYNYARLRNITPTLETKFRVGGARSALHKTPPTLVLSPHSLSGGGVISSVLCPSRVCAARPKSWQLVRSVQHNWRTIQRRPR